MQKPKRKISLIEAQHRRLDALDRWFQFINDERKITPENFDHELLFPTRWGLGRKGVDMLVRPTHAQVEEIKMQITDGLRALAEGRQWVIPVEDLGHFAVVISQGGTGYEGGVAAHALLGIPDLLQGEEWRAAGCAWCGKLFLKKKRGTYCGLSCSQRMRTWKVRNPAPRWPRLIAAAKQAHVPIATWIRAQPKQSEEKPGSCTQCGGLLGPLAERCPLAGCKYAKHGIEEQP